MIDRKGITDRVTLEGMTLMNWQTYLLPMDEKFISTLNQGQKANTVNANNQVGTFFKGNFNLDQTGDTYFDMSNYSKGIIYVGLTQQLSLRNKMPK